MPHRTLRSLVALLVVVATLGVTTTVARAAPGARGCDVEVTPADDVVRAVDRAGPGATVCLRQGTYRLTRPLRPHRGQTLVGPRAVLDGSRVLRGWRREGRVWVVGGQHQEGQRTGTCLRGRACTYPDDVLRDGRPLRRVLSRADVGPGRYWFDYRRDRILLGGDPRGHALSVLVSRGGIASRAGARGADVTVRGLTVQHMASPAQHGAIEVTAPGWLVTGTVVRDNHGAGITAGGRVRLLDNRVVRNGQLGIGGVGVDTVVAGNTIGDNGGGGFDPAWEAGGAKWAVTDRLVVRRNLVVGNHGPGLWTDIDAQHTTYARNVVRGNSGPGIFHEISADAVIRDNLVTGNGHGSATWLWGSGVLVAGSHDVDVVGNRLAGNAAGIGLVQQDRGVSDVDGTPRRLHDVRVRDNGVRLARSETGMVQDDGDRSVFDDDTITWTGNTWLQRGPTPFLWDDAALTLAQWRALGHDVPASTPRDSP
ncbi:hypothetical protein GCM10023340_25950 [Nocardioides marinquilinus]|uniref:Right handed beta helix domain-containing protein n=1 Tax=Nocardioides marinquilinus TaxID=1210400 RepID=A0ABP9PP90_9ACTN